MPTTDHPTCPMCLAMATPIPLDMFEARTRRFEEAHCLCDGSHHRVLMKHDHVHKGCAGYAWQALAITEEIPHGDS